MTLKFFYISGGHMKPVSHYCDIGSLCVGNPSVCLQNDIIEFIENLICFTNGY